MIQIARGRRNALQVLEARFLTSFVRHWTKLRVPYAYWLPLQVSKERICKYIVYEPSIIEEGLVGGGGKLGDHK